MICNPVLPTRNVQLTCSVVLALRLEASKMNTDCSVDWIRHANALINTRRVFCKRFMNWAPIIENMVNIHRPH